MKILYTSGIQQNVKPYVVPHGVQIDKVTLNQGDLESLSKLNPVALHGWLMDLYVRFPPPTEKDEHNE